MDRLRAFLPRSRRPYLLLGVYLLAVLVRLVFLFEAQDNPLYQHPTIDERTHHEIAITLVEGTAPDCGYLRSPGYLYALALLYKVFGPDALLARYVQVFFAALAPVLVCLITRDLFGDVEAVIAGVLTAVYWTFVFFSAELLDVTLACVLYLVLLYLLIRLDDRAWYKWLACGVVMGVGAVVRPNILAYAPLLAFLIFWRARKRHHARSDRGRPRVWLKAGLSRVAVLASTCILAIAPVTIRNIVVAGEPILIAAWGSGVFWVANNPISDEKGMIRPPLNDTFPEFWQELCEHPWFKWDDLTKAGYLFAAQQLGYVPSMKEGKAFYDKLARDYVLEHPDKLASDMFKRFCHLLDAFEYPFNKDLYHFLRFSRLLWLLSWLHYGVLCPIGVLGLLLLLTRCPWRPGIGYHLWMLAALALPSTLFPIISRYRLTVVYILVPLVAYAVVEMVRLLVTAGKRWQLIPWVGVLAVLAVISNANLFDYRPARSEHLKVHFLGAAVATGQHDLAIETADEIAEVLQDPERAENLPPNAIVPVFRYLVKRGEQERAAFHGMAMLRRGDRPDARTIARLVKVLSELKRREDALYAMSELDRRFPGSPFCAPARLWYGRAFGDRAALETAIERLERMHQAQPANDEVRKLLTDAKRALRDLQGSATSRTKPRASRPAVVR